MRQLIIKADLSLVFSIKTTEKTDFKKFGSVMVILRKYTNVETVKNKDFTRNSMRMETLKLELIIKTVLNMDFTKNPMIMTTIQFINKLTTKMVFYMDL